MLGLLKLEIFNYFANMGYPYLQPLNQSTNQPINNIYIFILNILSKK